MNHRNVYIIAEAGVNHNGKFDLACQLVDEARKAGADCIKFQTFITENVVSPTAQQAEYQKKTVRENSQRDMLKKLELPFEDFVRLKAYCEQSGITFLSTPFDMESVRFLATMKMPFWKIPSGDVTNFPYLIALAKTRKPVLMSTGMCEMDEIERALNILRENGTTDIKLLHCNTEYPTPFEDVNLRAMNTLSEYFHLDVGYSDHTTGIEVPIAAAALGAVVIEKHFTLDRNMEGPDHKASLEPEELKAMVTAVRNIEKAMGTGEKTVTQSEEKNKAAARKSIVAKKDIKKGEFLTAHNMATKRPGNGLSPMRWPEAIGTRAIRDFQKDELIEL